MIHGLSMIAPLFSYLLCVSIAMLALSTGYPNQKFVLFKKLPDGRIRKVETFTEPISREQAISMYGSDHYMLQSMKPRTRTIWNDLSGYSKEGSEKNEVHVIELQRIDRKTNYLTGGLVGLGIASAIGFGATAVTLLNNNQLLTRATMAIDGLMSSYPIPGFLCGTCRAPLVSVFDKYCNQCGYPITSPDRRQLASATEQRCPHCSFPIRQGQHYCRDCGKPLPNESSRTGWSLS